MELIHSDRELKKAKKCLNEMKEIKSKENQNLLIDFESKWIDFLHNLEKVWKKAELECSNIQNFEPWQGSFKSARRKDPLLKYLKNARDADQHSIQPITIKKDSEINITSPKDGAVFYSGDAIKITSEIKNPRIETKPFKNRGVIYEPPIEHLGQKLKDPNDPIELAELGTKYYEEFLNKIREKFN